MHIDDGCSGYEVYDRLSPSFAKYLETLEAVHEARFFHHIAQALGNKLRDGMSYLESTVCLRRS